MEKYGCNRLKEIELRICQLEKTRFKMAEENIELRKLKEARAAILREEEKES